MRVLEEQGIPIILPKGQACIALSNYQQRLGREPLDLKVGEFEPRPFRIRDIIVQPFVVPHDLNPTVGFRFMLERTGAKGPVISIATDFGQETNTAVSGFAGAKVMVVEANYDEHLLEQSPRPLSQKLRISGPNGHLSNLQAANLIIRAMKKGGPPQTIMLAHLSGDHNEPKLALQSVLDRLYMHCLRVPPVIVARRDRESDWIVVT